MATCRKHWLRYLRIPWRFLNNIKSCQLEIALSNIGVTAALEYQNKKADINNASVVDSFRISSPYTWSPKYADKLFPADSYPQL